jgi:hypothetical protein
MALGKEIRLTLGREAVLDGDRSLDLLLGVIVYVTWYVTSRFAIDVNSRLTWLTG